MIGVQPRHRPGAVNIPLRCALLAKEVMAGRGLQIGPNHARPAWRAAIGVDRGIQLQRKHWRHAARIQQDPVAAYLSPTLHTLRVARRAFGFVTLLLLAACAHPGRFTYIAPGPGGFIGTRFAKGALYEISGGAEQWSAFAK